MIKKQKQKITKFQYITLFLLLFVSTILFPFSSTIKAATDEKVERIYDYAHTLTQEEKNKLENLAESYYQETGNNYLIVTTTTRDEYEYTLSSSLERDCELYSKAFYKYFIEFNGNSYKNCTILTIDLSSNRYANISGQGDLKKKIDNERCTQASKQIKTLLTKKNYAKAYTKYMNTVNRYQKITPGMNPDSIFLKIWFQLLVSVAIGGIIIGIMIYQSGGKMTANGQTYIDNERSRILRREDHYIRTHTTRTKRETNSDNDSGSGGSSEGSNGGTHF